MFDESKVKRIPKGVPEGGQFASHDGAGGTHEATKAETERLKAHGVADKKLTPAEKIASVRIDFNRDNLLPELNEEDLNKIGVDKNKPVLLKRNVIDRNINEHSDVSKNDMEHIIGKALYNPSYVFAANSEKPNYYHFASFVELSAKGKLKIGMTLLDVDVKKDCFEIVHIHFVDPRGLQRAINKANKKD